MATAASNLVAVTGANGFLGLALVEGLLSQGHAVRAIARREAGIHDIENEPSLKPHVSGGLLTTALVPDDDQAATAYKRAFQGAKYVIHTAAPLLFVPGDHVGPAMKLTKDILSAIEATPSVSRLIVTGSMSSIKPWQRLLRPGHPSYSKQESAEEAPVLKSSTTYPTPDPAPGADAPPFERYTASKIATHNYLREYVSSHAHSHFSIVAILPGMILGRKMTGRDKRAGMMCSNSMLAFLFRPFPQGRWVGDNADEDHPMLSEAVALSDVVDAHVRALDVKVSEGALQTFLLSASWREGFQWADADEVAKALYPEVVKKEGMRMGKAPETIHEKIDCDDTEQILLGREIKSFRVAAAEFLTWYMTLPRPQT